MKKAISLFLSILMLLSVVVTTQVAVFADDTVDSSKTYVKADGVLYEVNKGDIYTYIFSMSCPDKITSFDAETRYDSAGLEFIPTLDEYGDKNKKAMFPVLQSVVSNLDVAGKLSYNYSNVDGVRFPVPADGVFTEKNYVFVGKFKVTGDSGIYAIDTLIETMADINKKILVYSFETVPGADFGTDADVMTDDMIPVEPIIPTEPTDPPATPDEPVVKIGDTDLDGVVNIYDATEIQLYLAKIKDLTATQKLAADADRDGIVNIYDVTQIQLYLAKFIPEL